MPTPDAHFEGYAEAVQAELRRRDYLAVFPSSDRALLVLGAPVAHLLDKSSLARHAIQAGIHVPPGRVFENGAELMAKRQSIEFPVMVKPLLGRHGRRCDGPHEIAYWAHHQERLLVQPYLSEPLHSVSGVMWRGRPVALVHQRYLRIWPPEAGGACAAETVDADPGVEAQVLRLLSGYDGIFHAQFAGEFLLDVNPRVYGSLPLAVKAGANLPAIYCDLRRGKDVPFVRARPGVFYRWLNADIRYAIWALRNGRMGPLKAARVLAPRAGVAHGGPISFGDPGPALAAIRYRIRGSWRRLRAGAGGEGFPSRGEARGP